MTDKKSRKELLKQEDAFTNFASQSAIWLKGHRTGVIVALAAFVVAAVSIWGAVEYRGSRSLAGSKVYSQGLELMDAQVVAAGTTADPTATPPTFASKEEKWKAARATFEKAAQAGGSTGVARLARFYVADLDAKLGEVDKALAGYTELEHALSADDNLYFLAVERRAYLLEQKNDRAGAIAAWQQLLGGRNRFYADHALYQLARLSFAAGDVAKARELLNRFEKEYTTSPLRETVEELYAQVGRDEVKQPDAAPASAEVPAQAAGERAKEQKATP